MPLVNEFIFEKQNRILVWEITEEITQLDELFKIFCPDFQIQTKSNEKLYKQSIASRILIGMAFPNQHIRFEKDEFNKPHLYVNNAQTLISITHTSNYACILTGSSKMGGLDIEKIDSRIYRVASKFVSSQEEKLLHTNDNNLILTLIWSAKESIYKYWGKKSLDFKKNMVIHNIDIPNQSIVASFIHDEVEMELNLQFIFFKEYVLTFLCN